LTGDTNSPWDCVGLLCCAKNDDQNKHWNQNDSSGDDASDRPASHWHPLG